MLWTVAYQSSLFMEFSRRECWSGLPCPPPGNLPHPGIELESLMSSALAGRYFTTSTIWEVSSEGYHLTSSCPHSTPPVSWPPHRPVTRSMPPPLRHQSQAPSSPAPNSYLPSSPTCLRTPPQELVLTEDPTFPTFVLSSASFISVLLTCSDGRLHQSGLLPGDLLHSCAHLFSKPFSCGKSPTLTDLTCLPFH